VTEKNWKESTVRFFDLQGRLQAVEVRRASTRPMVAAAHAALLALGIVVTSYRANPSPNGLQERFELAREDGGDLDEQRSQSVRSLMLPLALEGASETNSEV
jgi:hypothetical protein